jgi:hypothetical protein
MGRTMLKENWYGKKPDAEMSATKEVHPAMTAMLRTICHAARRASDRREGRWPGKFCNDYWMCLSDAAISEKRVVEFKPLVREEGHRAARMGQGK